MQASASLFAHTPFFAGSEHALPPGQVAVPQQTPSVQKREPSQGVVLLQGWPRPGAGTQVVPLHTKPAAQSAVTPHVVLQVALPHANAPHSFGTSLHLPTPSQKLACVSTPAVQALVLQPAVAGG